MSGPLRRSPSSAKDSLVQRSQGLCKATPPTYLSYVLQLTNNKIEYFVQPFILASHVLYREWVNLVMVGVWFQEHPNVRKMVSPYKSTYCQSFDKKHLPNVQTKITDRMLNMLGLFISKCFHITLASVERVVGHPGIEKRKRVWFIIQVCTKTNQITDDRSINTPHFIEQQKRSIVLVPLANTLHRNLTSGMSSFLAAHFGSTTSTKDGELVQSTGLLTAGLKRGGGVLSFLASVERFLTTLLWMAQLMQQCSFTYSFGST